MTTFRNKRIRRHIRLVKLIGRYLYNIYARIFLMISNFFFFSDSLQYRSAGVNDLRQHVPHFPFFFFWPFPFSFVVGPFSIFICGWKALISTSEIRTAPNCHTSESYGLKSIHKRRGKRDSVLNAQKMALLLWGIFTLRTSACRCHGGCTCPPHPITSQLKFGSAQVASLHFTCWN